MKSYKLSQRQKNIIHIIGDNTDAYITVNDIAEKIDVSARTVQRDLALIEDFLFENDFSLIKKPGKGLVLNESAESIAYLYELLEMVDSSKQYERVERVNFILSRLLTTKQPIKYFVFTLYLNISEKTLIEDLTVIDKWLSVYNIKLIRKRGVGLSLEGSEKAIRKAQAKLINEVLNDDRKIEILRDIYDDVKVDLIRQNDILSMIDINIINRTKKSLDKTFERLNISISDNSYFSLLVHISLAIERLKQDKHIVFNEDLLKNLKSSDDYNFAKQIIEDLEDEFEIEIPDVEIYFVAMHIKGTKIVTYRNENIDIEETNQAFNITNKLIKKMSEIYGLELEKDLKLQNDLRGHILPALSRLKYRLAIKNPILEEIKEKYYEIYSSLKKIAPQIIREEGKLDQSIKIPDDEIGYIAIHFITAIEARIVNKIGVNILTVCPTGYGTSRLLATKIANHFSNANIVNNASIMELNRDFLEANDVDLIVSTIKIDKIMEDNDIRNFSYIEMPALAGEDDYLKLTNKLREISRKKYYQKQNKDGLGKENPEQRSKGQEIDLGQKIFDISINLNMLFETIKYFSLEKTDDPYKKSAKAISNTNGEYQTILEAILKRNDLNPTYYEELNLHLLHAKCEIEEAKLGFANIKDSDDIVIIMMSRIDERDEIIRFFSEISSKIIDDIGFVEDIKSLKKVEITRRLKEIIYIIIRQNLGKEGE
ncbi:BglG family transcription antiterminator [Anaerococcus hydrogenalis]|uniref:BglG family transcription antiterminator n=1 Tax=Anaerococcus hydrogenalis TaxID=33029 RepID=UPI0023F21003|nr:PRD domain-containing protein [Anaerococcus hydrogenalis]